MRRKKQSKDNKLKDKQKEKKKDMERQRTREISCHASRQKQKTDRQTEQTDIQTMPRQCQKDLTMLPFQWLEQCVPENAVTSPGTKLRLSSTIAKNCSLRWS